RAMSWMWRFFSPRERVLPSAASFMLPSAGPERTEGYANTCAGTRAPATYTSIADPFTGRGLDDDAAQDHPRLRRGCYRSCHFRRTRLRRDAGTGAFVLPPRLGAGMRQHRHLQCGGVSERYRRIWRRAAAHAPGRPTCPGERTAD